MVVPYGDPGPMHGWKNAFDAGEWGLGRMANSLQLGCDCLGVIHYFDAVLATEQGDPYTVEHAICMHEEDYGILWKHHDLHGGTDETRRSRRLVVSFIATVGNYEYGFYWYFYLDGNIQLEVKLTGIVSPMAITAGEQPEFANVIAPGLAAPHHQHLFSARLDLDVDGPENSVYEVEAESGSRRARTTPGATRSGRSVTPLATRARRAARHQRRDQPLVARRQRGEPQRGSDQPVGYKLDPDHVDADDARVAGVERRPPRRVRPPQPVGHARTTPTNGGPRASSRTSTRAATGSPAGPQPTASLVDTDVVLWYTFGVTHFVRPEDWPVMPVEYTGLPARAVRLLRPQPRARRRREHQHRELPRSEERVMTGYGGAHGPHGGRDRRGERDRSRGHRGVRRRGHAGAHDRPRRGRSSRRTRERLVAGGAEVRTLAVDVTDPDSVERAAARAVERSGSCTSR